MPAARPAIAITLGMLALAGCSSPKSSSVAGGGAAATTARSASPPSNQTQLQAALLKFAECMRSNGVPAFPDPSADGGFQFTPNSGVDPSSTAMKSAQAKCRKLMPGGGPLSPGTTTHPTAHWLALMIKAAHCMRRHGISNFPDPTTTVPPMPTGGRGQISDIDGVIFTFNNTIDPQSPAFARAARTCGFPLHNR